MKYTLLEIVQDTLGSMDSDLVDSIGETVESEQIVTVAKEQFYEIATYQRVPQFEKLTQLIGLSDKDTATVMKIPQGCTDIRDIRYKHTHKNLTQTFEDVKFVEKDEFLAKQLKLAVGGKDVGENILEGNIRIPYRTDVGPTMWTTFDDEHIVFDAIDTKIQKDNTLYNDNSLVLAYIVPEFELKDEFVIPLPIKLMSQYLNMIKEIAHYEQRQTDNILRTNRAERQNNRNRNFGSITDGSDQGNSDFRRIQYGRRVGRYR